MVYRMFLNFFKDHEDADKWAPEFVRACMDEVAARQAVEGGSKGAEGLRTCCNGRCTMGTSGCNAFLGCVYIDDGCNVFLNVYIYLRRCVFACCLLPIMWRCLQEIACTSNHRGRRRKEGVS